MKGGYYWEKEEKNIADIEINKIFLTCRKNQGK